MYTSREGAYTYSRIYIYLQRVDCYFAILNSREKAAIIDCITPKSMLCDTLKSELSVEASIHTER